MAKTSDERRRVRIFLALLSLAAAAVAALAAGTAADRGTADRRAERALAAELRLTGLALWPQASYCRHPSQADLFAPHAVHPAAPDRLPAGSIVPPRPALGLAGGEGTGGP